MEILRIIRAERQYPLRKSAAKRLSHFLAERVRVMEERAAAGCDIWTGEPDDRMLLAFVPELEEKVCPICGLLFAPKSETQRYCGVLCYVESARRRKKLRAHCL